MGAGGCGVWKVGGTNLVLEIIPGGRELSSFEMELVMFKKIETMTQHLRS